MKQKTGQIAKVTVALPESMLKELDRIAGEEHRSRSGQIQFFLSKEVARRDTSCENAQRATA